MLSPSTGSCPPRQPRPLRLVAQASVIAIIAAFAGCVAPAEPEPASLSTAPPPWPAPRDAISTIAAAGLEALPLSENTDPLVVTVSIVVDGQPVQIPAHVGIDRVRAVQAPVHTHDSSGQVWLEGRGNRAVTLGQFFTVWGVRFDGDCLGAVCGQVTVSADGRPVTDPRALVLSQNHTVEVRALSD